MLSITPTLININLFSSINNQINIANKVSTIFKNKKIFAMLSALEIFINLQKLKISLRVKSVEQLNAFSLFLVVSIKNKNEKNKFFHFASLRYKIRRFCIMKSKTLIEKQLKRKNNPELIETLISAKKNKKWLKVAEILSSPTRKRISLNLNEIDGQAKDGEKIVVPGKVLSNGEISKKIKIAALSFSKKAEEKLISAGCKTSTILNEIKINPSADGIRILK